MATSCRPRPGSKRGRPSSWPDSGRARMTNATAAADPMVGGGAISGKAARPLLPASAYYAVFFALPMVGLFVLSFWRAKGFDLIPTFTLDNYEKIWGSALHRTLLLRTVIIGFV